MAVAHAPCVKIIALHLHNVCPRASLTANRGYHRNSLGGDITGILPAGVTTWLTLPPGHRNTPTKPPEHPCDRQGGCPRTTAGLAKRATETHTPNTAPNPSCYSSLRSPVSLHTPRCIQPPHENPLHPASHCSPPFLVFGVLCFLHKPPPPLQLHMPQFLVTQKS